MNISSVYGRKSWQRETEMVKRDLIILSRGSFEKLKAAIEPAKKIVGCVDR